MKLTTEITITEPAKTHLVAVASGFAGLRLEIKGGKGCGGNEYDLHPVLDGGVDPQDDFMELDGGIKLFIAPLDMIKLFGVTIDYIEDDLGNRRIDIRNPNETGRCGCGKSVTF